MYILDFLIDHLCFTNQRCFYGPTLFLYIIYSSIFYLNYVIMFQFNIYIILLSSACVNTSNCRFV